VQRVHHWQRDVLFLPMIPGTSASGRAGSCADTLRRRRKLSVFRRL